MKKVILIVTFLGLSKLSLFGELYISEYIEGSSYNKALEIYNAGPDTIDLAAGDYVIEVYFNGKTVANMTIELSGEIAPKDVYVI